MKVVSPTFIDHVGNGSSPAAKLRPVGIGQNRHFADSFQVGGLKRLAIDRVIVVVLPVDQEIVLPWPRPVHREINSIAYATGSRVLYARQRQHQRYGI